MCSNLKNFQFFLKNKSINSNKCIVFPEGNNIKILNAVSICSDLKISTCIIFGIKKYIKKIFFQNNFFLNENIIIVDPNNIRKKYIKLFIKLQNNGSINKNISIDFLNNNIFLALIMVYIGDVDGVVAGISCSTTIVIQFILKIFKTSYPNIFISSIFFMLFPDDILVYGDCAINRDPNSKQLADIAIQASYTAKLVDIKPKIAFLSYSTNDSGIGTSVDKIKYATKLAQCLRPDLLIEGPLQYDAAVNKDIAYIKNPTSLLKGNANILIFPDLNSGNITYKAVQQSSNIMSIGPILQGLPKPINDLSRGASVDDIIYTIIITVIQSINQYTS